MSKIKKNTVIEGYKLVKSCGDGGNSSVWKAIGDNEQNNGEFAIKFLNEDANSKTVERFKNEIEIMKILEHENVAKIVHFGVHQSRHYHITKFHSKTFRDVIRDEICHNTLLDFIIELCKGIQYIHSKGVFHRDLKPENILVNEKKLIITDFGISHNPATELTVASDRLANAFYASPQQLIKNGAKEVGHEDDLYALGKIINECFTKNRLDGKGYKKVQDVFPHLYKIDDIVDGLIRYNPNERITIEEVIFELTKVQEDFSEFESNITDYLCNIENEEDARKVAPTIFFAEHLFEKCDSQKLEEYNKNYNPHENITYSVSNFLFNICVQEMIHANCQGKFLSEGGNHKKHPYDSLDLKKKEHLNLYSNFREIIETYSTAETVYLEGQSLKYFTSCVDYHCEEIILSVKNGIKDAEENLKDAPIFWIIAYLKNTIKENSHIFKELKLHENLEVEISFSAKVFPDLYDFSANKKLYLEDTIGAEELLKNKFHATIRRLDNSRYSGTVILFQSDEYEKFECFFNKYRTENIPPKFVKKYGFFSFEEVDEILAKAEISGGYRKMNLNPWSLRQVNKLLMLPEYL